MWSLLWLLLLIYHIHYLSLDYFQYYVNADVLLSIADLIQVPPVTVCFRIVDVIKWETLTDHQWHILMNNVFQRKLTKEQEDHAIDVITANNSILQRFLLEAQVTEIHNNFYSGEFNVSEIFALTENITDIFHLP